MNKLIFDQDDTEYHLIVSINSDDHEYIVYSDNEKDADGFIKLYAGIYNEDKSEMLEVNSEEEWNMIEYIINKLNKEEQ